MTSSVRVTGSRPDLGPGGARLRWEAFDVGDDVGALQDKLHRLREHQSRETLERWKSLAAAHALPELFAELIDQHYDPLYHRSQNHNYVNYADALRVDSADLSAAGVRELATRILAGAAG